MNSSNYFNEVANKWDDMRENFFSESIREKACSVAGLEKGKLAADIGAGTGFIAEALLNEGMKVIAVDFSEEMLGQMQQKFKDFSSIQYRQGESENLPIESASVDYAMANMYLHHVENPLNGIKEMTRILKPGGKLILTDLDEHNFEFLRTEQFDRWMGFKREDIKQWFTEAGLKNITIDCAGGNCCSTSNSGCENASISIFIAYGER